MTGTMTLIVLGLFGLATLLLMLARQLIRDVARTAEEWQKLKKVLRRSHDDQLPEQSTRTCIEGRDPLASTASPARHDDQDDD